MRIAFLGLLLANLVVFGWSQWLAPGEPPPAAAATAAASGTTGGRAPARILLASEAPATAAPAAAGAVVATPEVAGTAAAGELPIDPAAPGAAASIAGEALPGAAGTANPVVTPGAVTSGAVAPAAVGAGAGTAAPAAAGAVNAALATLARRCASMGPFTDLELTAQATQMLKQDGYEPRQRPANGAVPDGYMVLIRQLRNSADQARVVGRLNRGGLDDAFAIPKLDDGYAVSVGLFSQQRRAERRAQVVANMGFKPEIVERTRPGTVYWLDFDLKSAPAAGSADPFAKPADPAQKWQLLPCPGTATVG